MTRDGRPRDRYASKFFRDVIGEDTRKVLKNKQRLRKAAEPVIETSDGRMFIKEGVVIGRTFTDGQFDDKRIRDEDTAVVRPCLEKRLNEGTTPQISTTFTATQIRLSSGELANLEPKEYPTGNYIRLILRTAEDGTVNNGLLSAQKDNVIEDCEDYIEIDKLGITYNTLKFLYIGNDEIYSNDIGGQLASLAQKAHQNIIAVCAYNSSGLGSIVGGADTKTIFWNAQQGTEDTITMSRDNMNLGEILYEDWGGIDKKGKWDYIMVSGDSNIKEAYETVSRNIKDSKNFIILSKDNNPQSYSSIASELKCSVLGAGVVYNNFSDQSLLSTGGQPSGVKQYITACCLFAKFYGTTDLMSFIPLYNADDGHTKDFYKEAEYHEGGDTSNVNRARADEIQDLVVKHYEDCVLGIN